MLLRVKEDVEETGLMVSPGSCSLMHIHCVYPKTRLDLSRLD